MTLIIIKNRTLSDKHQYVDLDSLGQELANIVSPLLPPSSTARSCMLVQTQSKVIANFSIGAKSPNNARNCIGFHDVRDYGTGITLSAVSGATAQDGLGVINLPAGFIYVLDLTIAMSSVGTNANSINQFPLFFTQLTKYNDAGPKYWEWDNYTDATISSFTERMKGSPNVGAQVTLPPSTLLTGTTTSDFTNRGSLYGSTNHRHAIVDATAGDVTVGYVFRDYQPGNLGPGNQNAFVVYGDTNNSLFTPNAASPGSTTCLINQFSV